MLYFGDKSVRCFTWLPAVMLLLGATLMFAGAFIPYDLVKSKLDTFAAGGDASIFDESWHQVISGRLKVFGAAALLGAILVYLAGKRIDLYFRDVISSAKLLSGKLKQRSLKQALSRERGHYITLMLLIFLGILVRLYYLNLPLKFDEAGSFLYDALRPVFTIASIYATPNNHILHSMLMRCAYLIFGAAPWALRLPAFISGVLLIPASYAVVRRLVNGSAALIAAGLAASSSLFIEYSVNARGYTLMVLLFLSILYLGSFLQERSDSCLWALLALLAALGIYTIPVMFYPFSIVICWLFLSAVMKKENTERLQRVKVIFSTLLLTGLITVMLYLPVFIVSGWEAVAANPFVVPQKWITLARLWPNTVLALLCQLNRDIPAVLQIVLAAALLVSVIFYRKLNILLISAVVAPLPFSFVQRVVPPPRVWIFWAFIFILTVSAGLDYLLSLAKMEKLPYAGHIYAIIVLGLAVILSLQVLRSEAIYYSNETGALRDAPEIVETLAPLLQEGDHIIAPAPSKAIIEYYLREKGLTNQYLWDDSDQWERVFVVVNESYSQNLYEVIRDSGLPGGDYRSPVIRGAYRDATLYEMVGIW